MLTFDLLIVIHQQTAIYTVHFFTTITNATLPLISPLPSSPLPSHRPDTFGANDRTRDTDLFATKQR